VAADAGKFWPYHDILFERQEQWAAIKDKNELKVLFADYAAQLDIDKDQFLEKIESQEVAARVSADVATGDAVTITGTPTFFVNGVQTPAPQLLAAVESALSQE
jgi:protein-disulfide isomerase